MIRRSVVAGAVVALFACGSAFAQAVPKEMAWTAYDTGSSGFNIAVAIGQQFKQVLRFGRTHPPVGQRHRPAVAGEGQSRRHLADGHRRVFRPGGRLRVRHQELGAAAGPPDDGRDRLQRPGPRRRQGYRREGGEGHQGQARRRRRRLAGADPGRAGADRLRRPDRQGRHPRAVLVQQRDVEGHHQQRGRRRADLDDLGPVEGSRQLAARHHLAAHAGRGQGGLGTGPQEGALLRAGEGDLRLGRTVAADPDHHGELRLSDLHDLRRPAGRHDRRHHQGR